MTKGKLRGAIGLALGSTLIPAIMFLLAGRIDYWQGWVYSALNILILGSTTVILWDKQDLIQERLDPGAGMKTWDKIYFIISTPLYFVTIVIAPLSVGRFRWESGAGVAIESLAIAIYVLGHSLFIWSKRTNKFFSSVVRIQTERGHVVCSDGPYRYIRHPGYLAGIMFGLATPLVLGSYYALIPAAVGAALLVVRTRMEDETLRNELPGYPEYQNRVKYRLLPGIW